MSRRGSRQMLLLQTGALGDDETLAELRRMIYAARGRPEVEAETES